jgi:hypothetical protein
MKTVVNKTHQPLKVPLPQGKVLHLGPDKTGEINDNAADHPPLKKLVEDGQLEIQSGAEHEGPGGGRGTGHAFTHGHPQGKVVHRRGDRGA